MTSKPSDLRTHRVDGTTGYPRGLVENREYDRLSAIARGYRTVGQQQLGGSLSGPRQRLASHHTHTNLAACQAGALALLQAKTE